MDEGAGEYDSENNPESANTLARTKGHKQPTMMRQSASHSALRPLKKFWQKGHRGGDRPQSAKGYVQITTTTTVKIEGLPSALVVSDM